MSKKIVSFGEIMLRLTPPAKQLLSETRAFDAYYGGSESNVLVCLSHLGDPTDYLTALPANDLGEATVRHLRSHGVGTEHILRQGDNLGMYFLEEGFGERPTAVVYNRKHSEVSRLDEDAFDYDAVFQDCSIFHICGISFAISQSARRLSFRLVREARARGIPVSFDFNYRSKLWSIEEAAEVYKEIVKDVDILFCSERDLVTFLDTSLEQFRTRYSCEYLIARERTVLSNERQSASVYAVHYAPGGARVCRVDGVEFSVLERIGSGDAFVGGVLHALNGDRDALDKALETGMACFVLKHTQKGDVFTLGMPAVNAYINNRSKDVSR